MENKSLKSFAENKLEEAQNKRVKPVKIKKKKAKKGIIVATLSVIMAAILAVSCFIGLKKKNNNNGTNTTPTTTTITVDDLGMEEELPKKNSDNKELGDTTGNIKKEDLVVDNDGTIWKDEEASNKKDEIGKVTTDDKEGTLVVKPNGTVTEKEQDYEVKDESGNVVDKGSNESGIPDGYAWDSGLNKYVKEDLVGKFVYLEANYYYEDGTLVYKIGEMVSKETLEKIQKELSTTKPSVNTTETKPAETKPTETKPAETTTVGVINQDGTYTIYGVTYMDKATFEEFLMDDNAAENFGYYNGVIYPVEVIEEMFIQNQKTK